MDTVMKKTIHPNYNKDTKITCACGAVFNVGSTSDNIRVEICSQCHPFYTGKEKLLDADGRVDKFRARMAAAQGFQKPKTRGKVEPITKDKEEKSNKEK